MADVGGNAGARADLDRLVHGVPEELPLRADVARVDPSAFGHRPCELDDLVGRGVHAGRVHEPGGEADGAGVERLLELVLHRGGLGRVRRPPLRAEHVAADRSVSDERSDVDRRAGLLHQVEVLQERAPRREGLGLYAAQRGRLGASDTGGAGAAAVPCHHGGDALAEGAVHGGLDERHHVGVAVAVDEPGSEHPAPGLHGPGGGGMLRGTGPDDPLDSISRDHDGAPERPPPRAVHDARIRDQEIRHRAES